MSDLPSLKAARARHAEVRLSETNSERLRRIEGTELALSLMRPVIEALKADKADFTNIGSFGYMNSTGWRLNLYGHYGNVFVETDTARPGVFIVSRRPHSMEVATVADVMEVAALLMEYSFPQAKLEAFEPKAAQ